MDRIVIAYEHLPWEMNPRHPFCGNGPLKVLLSDGEEIVIKPGLGPGYWDRARKELTKLGIKDSDQVLPVIL